MGNRDKGVEEIHGRKEVRVFKRAFIYIYIYIYTLYILISVFSHIYWSFNVAGTLVMFISLLNIHNLNS